MKAERRRQAMSWADGFWSVCNLQTGERRFVAASAPEPCRFPGADLFFTNIWRFAIRECI
jgi:hypothetical protein